MREPATESLSRPFHQPHHPDGIPEANLKSIYHRCHPILVAFVWELTEETIDLPLGCLQGGKRTRIEFIDPGFSHFEPSLDALSLRSDVIRSIQILSLVGALRRTVVNSVWLKHPESRPLPWAVQGYLAHKKPTPPRTLQ